VIENLVSTIQGKFTHKWLTFKPYHLGWWHFRIWDKCGKSLQIISGLKPTYIMF